MLAEHAAGLDTGQLRQAAARILGFLHPDGTLTPDRVHRADRDVALRRNADGSGDVRAQLTPACYALWETILQPLARKRPDDGCGPDTRSPGSAGTTRSRTPPNDSSAPANCPAPPGW